jgi:hypothetical protein
VVFSAGAAVLEACCLLKMKEATIRAFKYTQHAVRHAHVEIEKLYRLKQRFSAMLNPKISKTELIKVSS